MKESYIKKLVRILEDSSIDSIQISSLWGYNKIKLSKSSNAKSVQSVNPPPQVIEVPRQEEKTQVISPNKEPETIEESIKEKSIDETESIIENKNIYHITAPLVGTFYSTPNPEEPSFIQKGDKIKPGQIVCIIEAMKIFNEIESDISGTVEEILVDNSSPVEYGQNIISIKLDD